MPIAKKVKNYLDKAGTEYEEIMHKTVYTAYDAAQTLKKELKEIAKNLLVQVDRTYALVIVPADKKIDLKKLKKALGAKKISIPKEKAMIRVLKIKPGAMSSFGKLHKLDTIVDKALLKTKKAIFSTGSFTDSVIMKVKDFVDMEEAILENFTSAGGYKIVKKQPKKKASSKKKTVRRKTPAKKKSVKKKPAKKKTSVKRKLAKRRTKK